MKHYIKSISLGALAALAVASASAQTPAPAAGASAPAAIGVTPQEAAAANQQAVPRSDTATVVRTAPSPAARASDAMSGSTGSTVGNGAMGSTRSARADRN